jgi:DNA-binding transcriptional LysR family regulator
MSNFDWNNLQSFLAMARAGRLTVAARRMGVDHSTLSRRISALEDAMQVKLFERRPEGFALTPEGEALLGDAEEIESLTVRMGARLQADTSKLTGNVRMGTPEGFGTYFLAPQLVHLSNKHPDLNIELVANPRSFSLSKREADIAISMARPSQGRVYARKLLDFGLGIYASRNYLDSHSPITTRQDLLAHGWIGYVEDLMWTSELDYLPMVDRNIQPRLHISNVISQLTAIEGGAGLGVLPHFMARQSPVLKRVLPTEIHLTRAYWLITHPDTHNLARIRACCDFLTEQAFAHGSDYWMSECS